MSYVEMKEYELLGKKYRQIKRQYKKQVKVIDLMLDDLVYFCQHIEIVRDTMKATDKETIRQRYYNLIKEMLED